MSLMFVKVKKSHIFLGLLLVVGISWTVWDYKEWQRTELENYGHGWGVDIPAMPLANLYENQFWGVRIRYPGGWVADEEKLFVDVPAKKKRGDFLRVGQRQVVVWLGKNVKVSIQREVQGLTELANAEEEIIRKKAGDSLKAREYANSDEVNVVYFTWQEGGVIHQRALAVEGERMVIVDSNALENDWKNLEPTFREMYKSLIIF